MKPWDSQPHANSKYFFQPCKPTKTLNAVVRTDLPLSWKREGFVFNLRRYGMPVKTQHFFIDLTQRPPRSFRVRLGNYVVLARMLDKGRATLAGKNGEYIYNSPTDQRLVQFLGFDPKALLKKLASGKSDGEMLEWVQAHSKTPRSPWEIEAWSAYMDKRAPDSDAETLAFFAKHLGRLSKTREDIKTFFEFGELDDYVSFGGKA
jgi:hypothetical protein